MVCKFEMLFVVHQTGSLMMAGTEPKASSQCLNKYFLRRHICILYLTFIQCFINFHTFFFPH